MQLITQLVYIVLNEVGEEKYMAKEYGFILKHNMGHSHKLTIIHQFSLFNISSKTDKLYNLIVYNPSGVVLLYIYFCNKQVLHQIQGKSCRENTDKAK